MDMVSGAPICYLQALARGRWPTNAAVARLAAKTAWTIRRSYRSRLPEATGRIGVALDMLAHDPLLSIRTLQRADVLHRRLGFQRMPILSP
jgi:hypothetical protein